MGGDLSIGCIVGAWLRSYWLELPKNSGVHMGLQPLLLSVIRSLNNQILSSSSSIRGTDCGRFPRAAR